MHVVLVHWRIKPDEDNINAFFKHWRESNTINVRDGLVAEFLSESLQQKTFQIPRGIWTLTQLVTSSHT
jgi:hypothetical protein